MKYAKTYYKDPDSTLDYKEDWTDWLAYADGDTIMLSDWTVAAGLVNAADSYNDTTATVWLSGGTAGESYEIANRITTAANRIDERTCLVIVRQR